MGRIADKHGLTPKYGGSPRRRGRRVDGWSVLNKLLKPTGKNKKEHSKKTGEPVVVKSGKPWSEWSLIAKILYITLLCFLLSMLFAIIYFGSR